MKRISSDSLSPILVKELRQGIRSKLFIGAFVSIQVFLFLYAATLLMSDGLRRDGQFENGLFWAALALPLLVLVPAMASQAIEKEVSGRTLELLLVTRLSSRRLVTGKWASVVVQSTLLVTSALPYLMLRYFLGGIDIWEELLAVGWLLATSSIFAGVAMGFWATKLSKLVKWGAVLLGFLVVPYGFLVFLFARRGLSAPFSGGVGEAMLFYGTLVTFLMLLLAASRIGPPAENHSTLLRIFALSCFPAGLYFNGMRDAQILSASLSLMILTMAMIGGLTEALRPIPRLYAPFMARGALTRLLILPFAPGWPGGLAFTGLVFGLAFLFPWWGVRIPWPVLLAAFGTLVFPAVLLRTRLPAARRTTGFYLLLILLSTAPLYVWGAATAFGHDILAVSIESILGLFPSTVLAIELAAPEEYVAAIAYPELGLVVGVSLIVLVRAARHEWAGLAASVSSPSSVAAEPSVLPVTGVSLS